MIEADFAWMNGKMIRFADAKVPITTHTLHYGGAVFEGIRCYKRSDGRSAIFRLREHIDRLFESARIVTTEIPFSRADLEKACIETVKANKLAECYLRPIAYVGAESLGLGARDN